MRNYRSGRGNGSNVARPLREQYEDTRYHVYSRGNGAAAIFAEPRAKEYFLSCVSAGLFEYGAVCHAYCIMDTHYHLLLETPERNLSELMHFIGSAYGSRLSIQGWIGHVFSSRFNSEIVEPASYFLALSRYIHRNPVKAGVASKPYEYLWSSYSFYLRPTAPPLQPLWMKTEATFSIFQTDLRAARKLYREFVELRKIPIGPSPRPGDLGSRQYLAFIDALDNSPGDMDPRSLHRVFTKPLSLDDLQGAVCRYYKIEHLQDPAETDRDKLRRAKYAFIYLAGEHTNASNEQIGKPFGNMSRQAISQQQVRTREHIQLGNERGKVLRDEILAIQAALGIEPTDL